MSESRPSASDLNNRIPIVPRICDRAGCENSLGPRNSRFCSRACHRASYRPDHAPTRVEVLAEMREAFRHAQEAIS